MIVFKYRGVNEQGLETSGTVEALDKKDALEKLQLLKAQGLHDISIDEVQQNGSVPSASAETNRRFCGSCGVENPSINRFCAGCGKPLGEAVLRQPTAWASANKQGAKLKPWQVVVGLVSIGVGLACMGISSVFIAATVKPSVAATPVSASGMATETSDQIVANALDNATTIIRQDADDTRVRAARADIKANLNTALKLYEMDNGSLPTTEEGLQVLLTSPPGAKRWNGPYVEQEPLDSWGQEYRYICPGQHGAFDLFSVGPDGSEGTADDITSWK